MGTKQVWIEDQQLTRGDVITLRVALHRFLEELEDEASITQFEIGMRASYRRRTSNLLRALAE